MQIDENSNWTKKFKTENKNKWNLNSNIKKLIKMT